MWDTNQMKRVQKIISRVLVVLGYVLLAACASQYASNGERIYLDAKNGPALIVPQGLSSTNISHRFDCPEPSQDNHSVSVEPPVSYQS